MTQPEKDRTADKSRRQRICCRCFTRNCARLAGVLTAGLPAGQTLQPTALVHQAYLRLVKSKDPGWEGRRHFFGAAARAMREILIEQVAPTGHFQTWRPGS